MTTTVLPLSLRSRVLRAGTWTIGGHVISQILRLGSNLIMTRLLVPEMFGIMALANVLMVGLSLFSDLGLRQSIVQSRRGVESDFLNTVWTLQIARGGLIWLLALGVAAGVYFLKSMHWSPAGSVYSDPVLPYIIASLAFGALIGGFESTKIATANRTLALGRLNMNELISQIAGLAAMLAWAAVDRSIWAMVAGSLFSNAVKAVLSHVAMPGEGNRLHWDHSAFQEIFRFGKWVFVSSILGFLAANGDRLLLGGLTDSATLGLYAIAYFMVSALRDVLAKLIGNVSFPALSEVARERPAMLMQTYYKFRAPVDVAALLATGLMFSAGHLLVQVFYDARYLPAGYMLEILSISLFEVRFSIATQCFMALGKTKVLAATSAIQVPILYILMPLVFARYGFSGALWIAGGSVLFTVPLTLYFKIKYGLFDAVQEIRVLPWLALGLGMGWVLDQSARHIHGLA